MTFVSWVCHCKSHRSRRWNSTTTRSANCINLWTYGVCIKKHMHHLCVFLIFFLQIQLFNSLWWTFLVVICGIFVYFRRDHIFWQYFLQSANLLWHISKIKERAKHKRALILCSGCVGEGDVLYSFPTYVNIFNKITFWGILYDNWGYDSFVGLLADGCIVVYLFPFLFFFWGLLSCNLEDHWIHSRQQRATLHLYPWFFTFWSDYFS